jgi:arabinofuranosyltransferase
VRARREQIIVVALVVGGLVHAGYVVAIGGDFMHARLLMPALFAVLVPVAVVPVERSRALAVAIVPWAILSLAVLRNPSIDPAKLRPGTPRELSMLISGSDHPVTTDDWSRSLTPPNPDLARREPGIYLANERLAGPGGPLRTASGGPDVVVVDYAVGLSSYLQPVDVYVLDALGLGDAFAAHLELEHRGLQGHEKAMPPAWIWARFVDPDQPVDTDLIRTPSLIADRTGTAIDKDQTDSELVADIAAARQALSCPGVERLSRVTSDPLTAGRVLHNFTDAFRLNGLRIPSDPEEAADLC